MIDAIYGVIIRALGGYTYKDMYGLEQFYVSEMDRKRQQYERLICYLQDVDRRVLDIHDRKRIAYSVPEKDYNVSSMKATLSDMTDRLDSLADEAMKRRHMPDKPRASDMPVGRVAGLWAK